MIFDYIMKLKQRIPPEMIEEASGSFNMDASIIEGNNTLGEGSFGGGTIRSKMNNTKSIINQTFNNNFSIMDTNVKPSGIKN